MPRRAGSTSGPGRAAPAEPDGLPVLSEGRKTRPCPRSDASAPDVEGDEADPRLAVEQQPNGFAAGLLGVVERRGAPRRLWARALADPAEAPPFHPPLFARQAA